MEQFILTTTLKQLRKAGFCYAWYNKVVRSLQNLPFTEEDKYRNAYARFAHKEEINLLDILESNGVDDCLGALSATTQNCDKVARLIAVKCAREVQYLMTDQRSLNALDVAERFASGEATEEELAAACDAAETAAGEAETAWVAGALGDKVAPAARAAGWAAAGTVWISRATALAAQSTRAIAGHSAGAEWIAAEAKQVEIIKSFLGS